jgi:phage-related tail fiber protein
MPIFRGKNIVSAVTDYKDSVRCATRTNVSLSSTVTTIDGVTLANDDRVLLAGQTFSNQNGIYKWTASSSTLSRAHDADSAFELTPGTRVYVEEGDTYARTNWTLITQGVITPGVTSIVFAKESYIGTANLSGTYGASDKTLQIVLDETGQITSITELDISVDGGSY